MFHSSCRTGDLRCATSVCIAKTHASHARLRTRSRPTTRLFEPQIIQPGGDPGNAATRNQADATRRRDGKSASPHTAAYCRPCRLSHNNSTPNFSLRLHTRSFRTAPPRGAGLASPPSTHRTQQHQPQRWPRHFRIRLRSTSQCNPCCTTKSRAHRQFIRGSGSVGGARTPFLPCGFVKCEAALTVPGRGCQARSTCPLSPRLRLYPHPDVVTCVDM